MTNSHLKSFFGQNSALIVESPQKSLPFIFLKCIKKKEDGSWEKMKEGKTVKITIEEIICILEVLNRKSANWRGYHVFKDYQTEIYVAWEDKSRQVCVFRIGDYEKKLRFPNNRFLTLLLKHILSEKIEFATSDTYANEEVDKEKISDENGDYRVFSEQIFARDGLQVIETTGHDLSPDKIEISAKIKAKSPKAILIDINGDKEFWIPKNTIHSKYDLEDREKIQKFLVDRWIIKKNKIKLN
jgi:hypothetical protein